jgi:hypothetical protein
MAIEAYLCILVALCLCTLCYAFHCLKRMAGDNFQAISEERRDLFQQFERIMEKKEVPVVHQSNLSAVHSQERTQRVHSDNVTKRESKPKATEPEKKVIFSTGEGLGAVNQ